MFKKLSALLTFIGFSPLIVSAHEAYVLDPVTMARDVAAQSPNPFSAIGEHQSQFIFWGFVAAGTVTTVFFMSSFRLFERAAAPFLRRLKRFASPIVRMTLGL